MLRSKAREQAFVLIFQKSFNDELTISEIIENAELADEFQHDAFTDMLTTGVYDNLTEIDELIKANLSGWKIERISRVALSLLRLAVFEIKFVEDIPVGVSINEAVELAKTYATSDDASYINGVLGAIARAE